MFTFNLSTGSFETIYQYWQASMLPGTIAYLVLVILLFAGGWRWAKNIARRNRREMVEALLVSLALAPGLYLEGGQWFLTVPGPLHLLQHLHLAFAGIPSLLPIAVVWTMAFYVLHNNSLGGPVPARDPIRD